MSAMSASRPQRVAVVGSGIAGLSAAYTIAKHGGDQVRVALYEKNDKIGGHAHTHTVGGKYPDVDVGFMVMNHTTYPNLLKLFAELQVPLEPTDMSFCVSQLPQDGERAKTWSFGYNWRVAAHAADAALLAVAVQHEPLSPRGFGCTRGFEYRSRGRHHTRLATAAGL